MDTPTTTLLLGDFDWSSSEAANALAKASSSSKL